MFIWAAFWHLKIPFCVQIWDQKYSDSCSNNNILTIIRITKIQLNAKLLCEMSITQVNLIKYWLHQSRINYTPPAMFYMFIAGYRSLGARAMVWLTLAADKLCHNILCVRVRGWAIEDRHARETLPAATVVCTSNRDIIVCRTEALF